jgi:hypothetical protein
MCPDCKNRGFKKTADTPYPTTTYKTDRVKRTHIVYRYKVCLQCGCKWITREDYERHVKSDPGLFEQETQSSSARASSSVKKQEWLKTKNRSRVI